MHQLDMPVVCSECYYCRAPGFFSRNTKSSLRPGVGCGVMTACGARGVSRVCMFPSSPAIAAPIGCVRLARTTKQNSCLPRCIS